MSSFLTNNALDLPELPSAPAAPDAGRRKLYFGDDGGLYAVDDAGTVVALQKIGVPGINPAIYEGEDLEAGSFEVSINLPISYTIAIIWAYIEETSGANGSVTIKPSSTWPGSTFVILPILANQQINQCLPIQLQNNAFVMTIAGSSVVNISLFLAAAL